MPSGRVRLTVNPSANPASDPAAILLMIPAEDIPSPEEAKSTDAAPKSRPRVMPSRTRPKESSQPSPSPRAMFFPMPANTRDGEWIPSRSFAPSTIPPRKSPIFSAIQEPMLLIPSHRPITMFFPISNTPETAELKPLKIAATTWGRTETRSGIALKMPSASLMRRSNPDRMIFG